MINYFQEHLGAKLFISYLAVILVGAIVLGLATRLTTPAAFNRHLGMMDQMAESNGMMDMMGSGTDSRPGMRWGQGNGFASELYTGFQESFNEALAWAALAAGVVALTVSLLISQRVVTPVRAMMSASQRIASGHFDERVQEQGSDELSQLARSFNQMAEQLQQVESLRRQLIADVAHELRTPLTAIKGSMEGLSDGVLSASQETYNQIHQEAARLNRLVDDLQELSRVEAGAYPLDLTPIDLVDLCRTIMKRLGGQFEAKQVELSVELPQGLPTIIGDSDRIIQILTNLLTNALRYTPPGGKVTVSAGQQGRQVHISVSDTGKGIQPEHLPHIFTRFYRVDKSRSRQAGGSGIGLTIARHLVEAHGGQIWAESAGAGKGSVFTFSLPLAG